MGGCECKCIKHMDEIGPRGEEFCALIVCDSIEDLKGILLLNSCNSVRASQRREVKQWVEREQTKGS